MSEKHCLTLEEAGFIDNDTEREFATAAIGLGFLVTHEPQRFHAPGVGITLPDVGLGIDGPNELITELTASEHLREKSKQRRVMANLTEDDQVPYLQLPLGALSGVEEALELCLEVAVGERTPQQAQLYISEKIAEKKRQRLEIHL